MGTMVQFSDEAPQLDVSLYGNVEEVNDTISKCRVRIFYKGLNRNRTYISDDFANQLISSLPYTPIKGIFNYADVDFEDHGEDNTDGRIYGIVPESNNFAWEKHVDKDGVEREYATSDVYLFTGLYPEANLICGKPQSMEIFRNTMQGEWKIWDDGKPYFHFYKGSFVGLQTLGREVEPCFEGSAFFSLYKNLQDCIDYIKNIDINNNTKEEGEKMDKTLFRISDNEKADILFDLINPNYNEEGGWVINGFVTDVYDDYALFVNREGYHRAYYTKDGDNITLGDITDVKIVDVTATEYAALEAMKTIGGTYEAAETSYNELKESVDTLKANEELYTNEKATLEAKITELETEKNTFTETLEAKDSAINEYESQISDLNAEKVRLEAEKNDIISENEKLESFKKNIETEQKTAIIDEFASHLTDEQIDSYKAAMDNYSVVDFKKEICTAAYDADPTIFSSRENDLIYKGGSADDDKADSGMLRILNKYKNGGNK